MPSLAVMLRNLSDGSKEEEWRQRKSVWREIKVGIVNGLIVSAVGYIFPILLTEMHIGPAVAAGPFATTVNDIFAIAIYYGLSFLLFLKML